MIVRIGSGSFEDFRVIVEGDWPTIPRIGETIITGSDDNALYGEFVVKHVAYQCGKGDDLHSVLVLVD
ncbi:hypothetical protein [Sphingobium abikonense]|uniref:hypothetical protein n=1 Tax=Sphingobium abikonense TaxID=86193 RepID=UPI003513BD4C